MFQCQSGRKKIPRHENPLPEKEYFPFRFLVKSWEQFSLMRSTLTKLFRSELRAWQLRYLIKRKLIYEQRLENPALIKEFQSELL